MKPIIIFCMFFVRFSCGNNELQPKFDDCLTNISFQNVLSFDTDDRNQNITNKIIDFPAEFYTNYVHGYSAIRLEVNTQNLAQNGTISINLGSANVFIRDFTTSGKYKHGEEREYSLDTEIKCYPSKNIEIEAALPTEVNITGTFTIVHADDNSTHEGSFSFRILNGSITKYFIISNNEIQSINVPPLITNLPLKIQFKADNKSETLLENNDLIILNKFESFLGSIFEQKLTEEITTNKKSLALFCSNIINIDQTDHNSNLNDIFIMPNAKSDIWNGINLTIGPIMINGLTYFNVAKISTTENINELNTDYNTKNIGVRLKIGALNGKFQWTYNDDEENQTRTFINQFSTNGVEFEAPFYRNSGSCGIGWITNVDKIQIGSRDENCSNEDEIINRVISENLRTIIKNTLQYTLKIEWRTRNLAGHGCGYY